MIQSFSKFLTEKNKKQVEKKAHNSTKEIEEKVCPKCGKKISECSSPDCGAGFYGPEQSNPVYH